MLPGRGSTDFRDFTEATEASAMMTRLGQVGIYLSICNVKCIHINMLNFSSICLQQNLETLLQLY